MDAAQDWPLDERRCVFCWKMFRGDRKPDTADISKLDKIHDAAKLRSDECALRILGNISQIYEVKIKLKYDKVCRQRFIDLKSFNDNTETKHTSKMLTRSNVQPFDWEKHCFICGKVCYEKKRDSWSLVESEIDIQKENMYTKMMTCAEALKDEEVPLRLRSLPNADLVNVKARYHRNNACYARYITKGGRSSSEQTFQSQSGSAYTRIAKLLKEQIETSIFDNKIILTLPTVREKFQHFHCETGSRHIIEDLCNLGHCISYDELRTFLTSAAEHTMTEQKRTESGGLVPSDIQPRCMGGNLIVGAADNWDHNERTVDGKRTTHAMTSIMIGKGFSDKRITRLPKARKRSLDVSNLDGLSLTHIVQYKKPTSRPEPVFLSPVYKNEISERDHGKFRIARMKELLYNIGRCADLFCDDISSEKHLPPWSIFQCIVNSENSANQVNQPSKIAFNPIIMAKPTDYNTVYTTLLRMKEVTAELGQQYAPVFFDMGLLTKALEIVWSKRDTLSGVIPCEGGMHLLMCIFASIGKLYGDAGLKDLLVESGVYAAGTVDMIMRGKDFDRALYAYKIIDDVLNRRFLSNFLKWCTENDQTIPDDLKHGVKHVIEDAVTRCPDDYSDFLEQMHQSISPLIDEFRMYGRQKSVTFRFWDDFLTEVLLPLKLFLVSSRTGNWELHQYAKRCLLPILFAADRNTYAKYMTVEILNMSRIPDDVQTGFADGDFVARISSGTCNKVWIDYVLEATQNKALKGSGGIIGLTLRGDALTRWFLSRSTSSKYSMNFHEATSCTDSSIATNSGRLHHTDTKSKINQYNEMCNQMSSVFEGTFIDPFNADTHPDKLIHIASGVKATSDIEISLTNALSKGAVSADKFVEDRLVVKPDGSSTPKSFYDQLPRLNIKTFADMKLKVKVKAKEINIDPDVMYQKLLAVNAYKKVPVERVFSYENTHVPLSMYQETGEMYSGTKSDMSKKLEELIGDKRYIIEKAECVLFDGMAVIQMLSAPKVPVTFLHMAKTFLQYILQKSRGIEGVKDIHIVFDRYFTDSIKLFTRRKRGDNQICKNVTVQANLLIQEDSWHDFLSYGHQKERLCQFYTDYIVHEGSSMLDANETLIISGGRNDITLKVTADLSSEVPELKSNQEEADTRLVLHSKYAAEQGAEDILVVASDTDVLMLLIHHYQQLKPSRVFILTGHTGKHTDPARYIPVHAIFNKLTYEQLEIMLSVYCLTGCDTCSSFRGKGKKKAYKIMMADPDTHLGLKHLGTASSVSKELKCACTLFVGELYGKKGCTSLNSLRCEKAKKSVRPKDMPPCENSFYYHILRCCLQLLIWRNALTGMHSFPPVTEFGYEYDDNQELTHVRMTQFMPAPELLNDLLCECAGACTDDCPCFSNNQPCTSVCSCSGDSGDTDSGICTNIFTLASILGDEYVDDEFITYE